MKKLSLICGIFFCLILINACGGGSSSSSSSAVAIADSTKMADSTTATYNVNVNSQYLTYEDEGKINIDSEITAINSNMAIIKSSQALSNKAFRQKIKLLRVGLKTCDDERIIKKPGTFRFNLQGLDFFVNNQKIVGVGSLDLSQDQLSAITEQYAINDELEYHYCVALTSQLYNENPNVQLIEFLTNSETSTLAKLDSISYSLSKVNQPAISSGSVNKAIDSLGKSNSEANPKSDSATTKKDAKTDTVTNKKKK